MGMEMVKGVAFWLVVVGAINWGLIGAFDYNLVTSLVSDSIANIIYILVGLSALLVGYDKIQG